MKKIDIKNIQKLLKAERKLLLLKTTALLQKKEAKINTKNLYPYEIIEKI